MAFLDSSRLGNSLSVRNSLDEFRYCCPFCADSSYHLYLNVRKQTFFCHRCNEKGKTNVTKQMLGNTYLSRTNTEIEKELLPLALPKSCEEIITPAARHYLVKRGIKESDVARHSLYAADTRSIYFGRIIIPCNPYLGFADYFVGRSYVGYAFPKYMNPPGGKNKLFISPSTPDNIFTQHWGEDSVMLVEGPFDYLKASRHGRTVCLLGKNLSNSLAREIFTRFSTVYVMLDKGVSETFAAMRIAETLEPHVDRFYSLVCPLKDPGEMGPEDFKLLLNSI